jgi:two-component system sensor histidine kinase AlgZ
MLRRFGRLRMPPTVDWLPQFCQPATVYSAMLLAEIVVVIAVFSPGESTTRWWLALSTGTVLAQWIALSTIAVLCLLRPRLAALPSGAALATVTAVLALTAWLMASLGFMLDRELEWGLLSPRQDRDRFVLGIVATVVLMAALGLRYGYVHVQWRLQIEARARTQVEALTARIRPHFLFNSMNTIAGLIHEDARLAERVIEDLSDLFRAALAAGERAHPLGRELELCRRYLAIEGLRLGERLRVDWDADAAPTDLPVPPLLLQPLVENAVYHGIQPLPEGGVVRVAATRDGNDLLLTIENPRPLEFVATAAGHGMAQENVRQRLHYAYSQRASLEVEERAGYYGVKLRLPLLALRESRS